MHIHVVVPTVTGREDHLERCLRAYYSQGAVSPHWVSVQVIRDRATCGVAWQEGADAAEEAGATHLHLTADDLVPHVGWLEAALEATAQECIPAPDVYKPDGGRESSGGLWGPVLGDWSPVEGTSVVPFCTIEQWRKIGPMLPIHYYTDNYFTTRARYAGFPVRLRSQYAFTHYWAQPGRGAGMTQAERMAYDKCVFEAAVYD